MQTVCQKDKRCLINFVLTRKWLLLSALSPSCHAQCVVSRSISRHGNFSQCVVWRSDLHTYICENSPVHKIGYSLEQIVQYIFPRQQQRYKNELPRNIDKHLMSYTLGRRISSLFRRSWFILHTTRCVALVGEILVLLVKCKYLKQLSIFIILFWLHFYAGIL